MINEIMQSIYTQVNKLIYDKETPGRLRPGEQNRFPPKTPQRNAECLALKENVKLYSLSIIMHFTIHIRGFFYCTFWNTCYHRDVQNDHFRSYISTIFQLFFSEFKFLTTHVKVHTFINQSLACLIIFTIL